MMSFSAEARQDVSEQPWEEQMALESELSTLGALLQDRTARHGVVGAALAVGRGDEIFEAATGLVNRNTGVEVTVDSVFQIGSITKLFTTTLIMQLVDEGSLELDVPVKRYLPEFQVADPKATEEITPAHLLCHTSGIDGDFFQDTGCGDDCVERYVLACAALPQLHPPGEMLSYCNAGFMIAGRIIEKLRGRPWHEVIGERIFAPLGLFSMGTEAEQAILHRAAVGHMGLGEEETQVVIPIWRLARSNAPAGSTPFARARDLIAFARLHLQGGTALDGTAILSPESVRRMQERRVVLPEHADADGWGLGWMLFDWSGERLIGHDGSTIGQASFLRVHPASGVGVSLLTTGGDAKSLYREIFQEVLGTLCGVSLRAAPEQSETIEVPLARYAGRYERLATGYEVAVENGSLVLDAVGRRPPMSLLPPARSALRAIAPDAFVVEHPGALVSSPILFSHFDEDGHPGYLHAGLRAAPRLNHGRKT
jgi:CubicO group peptidase (beta-lactamase class C family)